MQNLFSIWMQQVSFDPEAVEKDVVRFGLNATYTGIDGLTLGGEAYMIDYDTGESIGFMAMGNKVINDMASVVFLLHLLITMPMLTRSLKLLHLY